MKHLIIDENNNVFKVMKVKFYDDFFGYIWTESKELLKRFDNRQDAEDYVVNHVSTK